MVSENIPVAELVALQRDVERLVARLGGPEAPAGEEWKPVIDVRLTDAEVVIRLEAPGMRAEELQVTVIGGVVSVRGTRERDREGPADSYVVRESSWGSFERRVSLPEGVDASRVRASYRDGVLVVRLPNASAMRERAVEVRRPARPAGEGATRGTPATPQAQPPAEPGRGEPHLFHGASEAETSPELGGAATGPHGTGDEELPAQEEGAPDLPGQELRYAPGHVPSQEEWLGRTSSGAASLETAEGEQAGPRPAEPSRETPPASKGPEATTPPQPGRRGLFRR